jgi:hypothetical protein
LAAGLQQMAQQPDDLAHHRCMKSYH